MDAFGSVPGADLPALLPSVQPPVRPARAPRREFVCIRCERGQCARCTDRACTCCYGNED